VGGGEEEREVWRFGGLKRFKISEKLRKMASILKMNEAVQANKSLVECVLDVVYI
jgi:hypothetical protein